MREDRSAGCANDGIVAARVIAVLVRVEDLGDLPPSSFAASRHFS
jgi:hypothetical protein